MENSPCIKLQGKMTNTEVQVDEKIKVTHQLHVVKPSSADKNAVNKMQGEAPTEYVSHVSENRAEQMPPASSHRPE